MVTLGYVPDYLLFAATNPIEARIEYLRRRGLLHIKDRGLVFFDEEWQWCSVCERIPYQKKLYTPAVRKYRRPAWSRNYV